MKAILVTLLISALAVSPQAVAAVSDDDLAHLREQLDLMSQRLDELAAENAELRRAQVQTESAVADVELSVAEVRSADATTQAEAWPDRIKLDGDFRYRYESISADGSSTRQRNRIRALHNQVNAIHISNSIQTRRSIDDLVDFHLKCNGQIPRLQLRFGRKLGPRPFRPLRRSSAVWVTADATARTEGAPGPY